MGDVLIWPSSPVIGPDGQADGPLSVLNIKLSSPFGEAHFEAPAEAIANFLDRTFRIVQMGRESQVIDIDAELNSLLWAGLNSPDLVTQATGHPGNLIAPWPAARSRPGLRADGNSRHLVPVSASPPLAVADVVTRSGSNSLTTAIWPATSRSISIRGTRRRIAACTSPESLGRSGDVGPQVDAPGRHTESPPPGKPGRWPPPHEACARTSSPSRRDPPACRRSGWCPRWPGARAPCSRWTSEAAVY